ncbi:efflux RND transporter permease subunit [Priestia filamentosa]|uniref:Swarming motility protein SwrC n=1 Tax=Priestia filamentosa TaxID=1402861 RepID=A0A1X7FS70_9BACI|nr:efflux RND transporter permease subunit [Priestia filamentosa]AKO94694.1 Swarming motility protein SwrC [Priestia filamentosa]MDT3765005.1 efflux RND transporter permease subunit [Priestia filamentosa]OXS66719.1 Swarming motility protein SwrC [Priestia filamentosa]WCM15595.1 efflux RND transporter permease subunit [Priestia filamentosa]WRU95317.1 efflux RND transporter permease subunit [Priestia filamentosa]
MKHIINFSLKNKFALWILTILVTIAGLYAGTSMKLETIPSITNPVLSITTTYPGASPEEVSKKVTDPVEQAVSNLTGVDTVSSSSRENMSIIQVQYAFDKDMDKALDEAKEAVNNLDLDENIEEPSIAQQSIDDFPILSLSISDDKKSVEELTTLTEEEIVPVLEGVEGVSSIETAGEQKQEVQFTYKEDKLKEYGLDKETVENLIKGAKVSYPLGTFNMEEKEKTIVLDGNIETVEDLKNLEIPVTPSQSAPSGEMTAGSVTSGIPTVKLSDIADIKVAEITESLSKTNGERSIGVQVVKTSEGNTVDVTNAVMDALKDIKEDNSGLKIATTLDQSVEINKSVSTMIEKALFGALFAVIIILLFLRDIRSTIISIISIPLSLLMAMIFLKQMDISLNIMTLGAMTVAIGRVVDDSIVVIENIYRRMALKEEKLRGKDLIREATKEMFKPILSSTIVTIAVFLPLGTVTGPVGELFLPFALTIVFALLSSLIIAITIVPMLAHSLFKKGVKSKNHEENAGRLSSFYKSVLQWSLNHKWIVSGLSIIILIASLFLAPLVGTSFLPEQEIKTVNVTFNPNPGELEEDVKEEAADAEKYFLDKKNVKTVQYSIGGGNPFDPGAQNQALFYVEYKEDTPNFNDEKEQIVKDLNKGQSIGEWNSLDISGMGNNSIELRVYGDNTEDLQAATEKVQNIMDDRKDLDKVESSLSEQNDQYTLVANQEELAKRGLSAGQIGMKLSQLGERPVLTTLNKDGKDLNVYIQTDKQDYSSINELEEETITSPLGQEVPLSDVVEVEEGKAPATISKLDGKMYATVSGEFKGQDVGAESTAIQKEVDKLDLPKNVSVEMGGVTEQINDSFTQLGLAMLAAIGIVYFVLVLTFGGGLAPFAILFSLPFTIIGGLLGLFIAGETISVSAMIGMLMLIGIVVTNAIVLIDRVIEKEKEGITTREALLEAASTRLRPILMTAIATIGALIPMAFGMESSGLISKGLAVTVIGGLTSSTLITLLIVPIVYEALMKLTRRRRK